MIVDAHVHFWDPQARHHTWLDDQPSLRRRFGPDDYHPGRHDVTAAVFVQADCREDEALAEVRWVAGLAARDPRIRGIVGYAPLHLGARARGALDAVADQPGVVGVRRLLQDEPLSVLRDPDLAAGLRLLPDRGLTFDLCVRGHQLPTVAALVAACPDVRFVLDHLGKPPVAAGELDPWRADLTLLASYDNVVCKLSGLTTEAAPGWRPDDLRPYLDHALTVFGPHRCMVGSDWPVATLATTIEGWFDIVGETLAALSTAERDAVLHGTASSVYRLS